MKRIIRLSKMKTTLQNPVAYELSILEENTALNMSDLVGKKISLTYGGKIFCSHCGKKTKKSYAQGHCYPCSMKLASCDLCILKPETCHFAKGTCREPEWGQENCFRPHLIYLANSSGLKVGITRKINIPFRWIDQGAGQALPIMEVKDRLTSGKIEVLFKKHISDKTDWRKMLRSDSAPVDLIQWRDKLLSELEEDLKAFDHLKLDETVLEIKYPVKHYPSKIKSINLEKVPEFSDELQGIKGQYLIFNSGVLNVRAHTGFEVTLETNHAAIDS